MLMLLRLAWMAEAADSFGAAAAAMAAAVVCVEVRVWRELLLLLLLALVQPVVTLVVLDMRTRCTRDGVGEMRAAAGAGPAEDDGVAAAPNGVADECARTIMMRRAGGGDGCGGGGDGIRGSTGAGAGDGEKCTNAR